MSAGKAAGRYVTGTFDLAVAGRRLRVELQVTTERTRPVKLLPLFRNVANAVVDVATKAAEAEGSTISCTKGCGACCRQLVPISAMEARGLLELVDAMPEPRASEIRARFTDARGRLEQANLLPRLIDPQPSPDEEIQALGLEYFAQGIPCPFLEDESCSIHLDRPAACREYLVTSAAEHCAQPTAENVVRVKMPAKVSRVLRQMEQPANGPHAPWVPLILALDWAGAHRDQTPPRTGKEWVGEFFARLTGTDVNRKPKQTR
jgi:Fe-S-cluster containining protein